jgi:F0F1-type ATP synthase membrane subunit b/b'
MTLFVKFTYKIINNILEKKIKDVAAEIDNSVEVLNDASKLFDEVTLEHTSIEKTLTETSMRIKHDDDAYYEKYISDLNNRAKSSKESFNNYLDIQYELSILNHKKDIIHQSLSDVLDFIDKNMNETQHNKLINASIENLAKKIS